MPLENTKSDFWGLVKEHDVHTIVMFNTVEEAGVSLHTYGMDVDRPLHSPTRYTSMKVYLKILCIYDKYHNIIY